jgi:Fe-S cluster assembly iron-binding protein IscA
MSIFTSTTIRDWETRGIRDVSFFLIKGWCAGEKVSVQEWMTEWNIVFNEWGITFYAKDSEWDFFREAKITRVWEKWILSQKDQLAGHCGCGSSFARKTGNPLRDKAEQIRLALKQKTKHHSDT